MNIITAEKASRCMDSVLSEAERDGIVLIRRADGMQFELTPVGRRKSSVDVPGVDFNLAPGELASIIREIRERD